MRCDGIVFFLCRLLFLDAGVVGVIGGVWTGGVILAGGRVVG